MLLKFTVILFNERGLTQYLRTLRLQVTILNCILGALVSAGFEVSATVGRTRELDEAFLEAPHTDLSQPGYNTIRTGER